MAISRSAIGVRHSRLTEIQADLSDINLLEGVLPKIFPEGDFSRVILINNAGTIGDIKQVGNLQPSAIQRTLNLNLAAPMILTDAFVRKYSHLLGEKLICNISSGAAHKPISGWAEYCSSKAGLAMLAQVAAEDLREKGFRVFSLAPGIVDTDMQAEIRTSGKADFPALERFISYQKEGQLSTSEDVAAKVFYLLSNPDLFPEVIQDVRKFDLP